MSELKWCWQIPVIDGVEREPIEIAVVTRAQWDRIEVAETIAHRAEHRANQAESERDSLRAALAQAEQAVAAAVAEECKHLRYTVEQAERLIAELRAQIAETDPPGKTLHVGAAAAEGEDTPHSSTRPAPGRREG
jgi:hypothetical protein